MSVDGYGETTSVIVHDILDLIGRELVRSGSDPVRQAWLEDQRERFSAALSSGRVLRDPASVAKLVVEVRQVRATILEGR